MLNIFLLISHLLSKSLINRAVLILELQHFSMHYYLNCICYMTYCWVFYPFGQFLIWVFSFLMFNIIIDMIQFRSAMQFFHLSPLFLLLYCLFSHLFLIFEYLKNFILPTILITIVFSLSFFLNLMDYSIHI